MFPLLEEYNWFHRIGTGYPQIWYIILFWVFAFGSCMGSFLNVCIWRIPRGESLSKAASHCGSCNTPIKWYDNIPLISYIVLGGKCRACKQHYSMRYFLVELICGTLFTLAILSAGLQKQPMAAGAFSCIAIFYAIGTAWIDAEHRIIPDKLSYPAILAGLILSGCFPEVWGTPETPWYTAVAVCAASGGFPALFLAIFAVIGKIITQKEVIGWGDVKYILASGVLTGLPGAVFSLFFASFSGTVYGTVYSIVTKRPLKRTAIPLGPFLAAGTLIWIFAGNFIWKLVWFLKFN
ncbi:MAG: prepilin peptidase [Lentisphaeria bacterium]|nr:prepilin peptidase [Lentisphaeria bacterium]